MSPPPHRSLRGQSIVRGQGRGLQRLALGAVISGAIALGAASPASAANPNEMSPVYDDVPGQLTKIVSADKTNRHQLKGTYSKAMVGRYDPAGDHIQGLAELGDRRIAVAQNGKKKGFVGISTGARNVNAQDGVAWVTTASKHPSGMQAAGALIAVAENEPNDVTIIDARNPNRPVLLPNATKWLLEDDIPGTLAAAGLAFDRTRNVYWLLLAGASRSMLCKSSVDSLTSPSGGAVDWDCGNLYTNKSRLTMAEGGTQLVFDTNGRLYAMAYESVAPKPSQADYSKSGIQRVHLSEISDLDSCTEVCATQRLIGTYRLGKIPSLADPGPNFRWGGTLRAGRSMAITSSQRALHGGPSRPYIVMLDRYWD